MAGVSSVRRRGTPRSGGSVLENPAARGEVVARREHRLLPNILETTVAIGFRGSRAFPRLLQVTRIPIRTGALIVNWARRIGLYRVLAVAAGALVLNIANAATLLHELFQDHVVLQ